MLREFKRNSGKNKAMGIWNIWKVKEKWYQGLPPICTFHYLSFHIDIDDIAIEIDIDRDRLEIEIQTHTHTILIVEFYKETRFRDSKSVFADCSLTFPSWGNQL